MLKNIMLWCVGISILSMGVYAQECRVFRVSGEPGWLPVAFLNKDTQAAEGIAFDLVKVIGEKLKIPVEIRTDLPWKRMLTYLETGEEIDMAAAMYRSDAKSDDGKEKYVLTDPYFVNESRVFVLKGKEFPLQKFEDLLGRVGGCSFGVSFGKEFDTFIKEHNLPLEGVPTKEQRIKKLVSGRNDYFIQDYMDGILYLKEHGLQDQIVALPFPLSVEDVVFAISPKSPCVTFLPQINAIINDMKHDGTLQAIIDKYTP